MNKQADQKTYYDTHSKARNFTMGDIVLVRNYHGEKKWVYGTIIEQLGPVSYRVKVKDYVWKCHADQCWQLASLLQIPQKLIWMNVIGLTEIRKMYRSLLLYLHYNSVEPPISQSTRRYPHRIRKPPDRYSK